MKFIYKSRTEQKNLSGRNFRLFATFTQFKDLVLHQYQVCQLFKYCNGTQALQNVLILLFQGLQRWQIIHIVQHLLQTKF